MKCFNKACQPLSSFVSQLGKYFGIHINSKVLSEFASFVLKKKSAYDLACSSLSLLCCNFLFFVRGLPTEHRLGHLAMTIQLSFSATLTEKAGIL